MSDKRDNVGHSIVTGVLYFVVGVVLFLSWDSISTLQLKVQYLEDWQHEINFAAFVASRVAKEKETPND